MVFPNLASKSPVLLIETMWILSPCSHIRSLWWAGLRMLRLEWACLMILKHNEVWKPLAQRPLAGVSALWRVTRETSQDILGKNLCWELLESWIHRCHKEEGRPYKFSGKDVQNVCNFRQGGTRHSSWVDWGLTTFLSQCLHLCASLCWQEFWLLHSLWITKLSFSVHFFLPQQTISKRTVLPFFLWIVFFLPKRLLKEFAPLSFAQLTLLQGHTTKKYI